MSMVVSQSAVPLVKSIRELASQRSGVAQLAAFTAHAREVAQATPMQLVDEFDHQDDPLMLWVLHREADARRLPPCLRWASVTRGSLSALQPTEDVAIGDEERQCLFVNWLADILWLIGHDRSLRPAEARWLGLFDAVPNSADWHGHAVRVFEDGLKQPDVFATRLGVGKRSRSATLTLTTAETDADRSQLLRVEELAGQLERYAIRHPDRSGLFTPSQIVERRLLARRMFVLAGRQHGLAAQYLSLMTGQPVSRQAFTRQLEAIEAARREAADSHQTDRTSTQATL